MKLYTVGTFYDGRDPSLAKSYTAYLMWYNPSWDGCVQVTIDAKNGTQAKRLAVKWRMAAELAMRPRNERKTNDKRLPSEDSKLTFYNDLREWRAVRAIDIQKALWAEMLERQSLLCTTCAGRGRINIGMTNEETCPQCRCYK